MRLVVVGDSFTEGIGDELPDGSVCGWADRVAAGLAVTLGEEILYANLAIRGRLLEAIVTEQLEAALALSPLPTTIILNGGGNDMMRRGGDMARLVTLTERAIRRCADAGVDLVLLAGPDPSGGLPLGAVMRRRGVRVTAGVEGLAARHGLVFVDVFGDVEIRRPVYWSPDRLHLNPEGHRRVAGLVLNGLGYPAAAHVVAPGPAEPRRLLAEVRYYREHVLPWLDRRLHGRSSGDGRTAKHLHWMPVGAPPASGSPAGA